MARTYGDFQSAVSEITDRLWEDYQVFITRDLSGVELEYLFVDAVFESLRRHGAKEALLVGWGIAADGGKHLLHLAVGTFPRADYLGVRYQAGKRSEVLHADTRPRGYQRNGALPPPADDKGEISYRLGHPFLRRRL